METNHELLRILGLEAMLRVKSRGIPPDKVIGPDGGEGFKDYLRRWHLFRDQRQGIDDGMGNIYLHRIGRSDADDHPHNHPWSFHAVILSGAYLEMTPYGEVKREEGDSYTRTPDDFHRLGLPWGPVWSLFITGPWMCDWGFHTPEGFIHWRDYLGIPAEAGT